MNVVRKRIAVLVVGAMLTFAHLAGHAYARADGVCGGIGTFDPVTEQCVEG